MKSIEYLTEIRKAAGLKHAVLSKIAVERGEAVFYLLTELNYTEEDVAYAGEISRRYACGLPARAHVAKSVPREEGVKKALTDLLASTYPAIGAFVKPEDVGVDVDGSGGRFYLRVDPAHLAACEEILDKLSEALGRMFCGTWLGSAEACKKEKGEIDRAAPPEEEALAGPRVFAIADYGAIDGASPRAAVYIADLDKEMTGITICGEITHIEERVTGKGKPFFSVTVSDGTGSMRATYFTKKATIEKVRSLRPGTRICLTGDYSFFNTSLSFTARAIDFGEPPKGWTPEARPSKPVPNSYRTVFPVPESDPEQADLFGKKALPPEFFKETFVVFDLETTGFGANPSAMDRIIEVGAVKIENGAICERFSTFVACPVKLPAEIVELTGITDEMLAGAPSVSDVIPDFYKFAAGSRLVAHNAAFDTRFIRFYGEREGYLFDHRQCDTLALAQELLRLKNYKLDTVADHFGFDFNHHRAYQDAFVTAKIFIELIRLKGCLPQ